MLTHHIPVFAVVVVINLFLLLLFFTQDMTWRTNVQKWVVTHPCIELTEYNTTITVSTLSYVLYVKYIVHTHTIYIYITTYTNENTGTSINNLPVPVIYITSRIVSTRMCVCVLCGVVSFIYYFGFGFRKENKLSSSLRVTMVSKMEPICVIYTEDVQYILNTILFVRYVTKEGNIHSTK